MEPLSNVSNDQEQDQSNSSDVEEDSDFLSSSSELAIDLEHYNLSKIDHDIIQPLPG